MALTLQIKDNDWVSVRQAFQKLSTKLGPTSKPIFAGITLDGLTASRLIYSNADGKLASVADLASWIAGTTNRITVTDDGDGTITLSAPQDLHTIATPTFADLTISNPSAIYALSHDNFADFSRQALRLD